MGQASQRNLAGDDQVPTRLGQCDEVIRRVHLGPMLPANFRGGRESWIGILRLAFPVS